MKAYISKDFLGALKFKKEYDIDNNESITPTTDKGYLDIELLKEKLVELKEQQDIGIAESMIMTTEGGGFVKSYAYDGDKTGNSQVLRFGIDTRSKLLQQKVEEYNTPLKKKIVEDLENTLSAIAKELFVKAYEQSFLSNSDKNEFIKLGTQLFRENNITKFPKLFVQIHTVDEIHLKLNEFSDQLNSSIINTNIDNISVDTKKTEKHQDIAITVKHLDVEKEVISLAINYLQNTSDIKTALVDIFERDLKIPAIGNVQTTHTVLLYNAGNEIVVIDPSNPQFSSHLANLSNKDGLPIIRVNYSDKIKIYAPLNEETQIGKYLIDHYGSVTGVANDQYRDCVDIAVKLAFRCNITKDINETYYSITNQATLYKALPASIEKYPLRIKQSSDVKICDNATKFLTLLQAKWKYYQQEIKPKFSNIFKINNVFQSIENKYENVLTELNKNGSLIEIKELYKDFARDVEPLGIEAKILEDIV